MDNVCTTHRFVPIQWMTLRWTMSTRLTAFRPFSGWLYYGQCVHDSPLSVQRLGEVGRDRERFPVGRQLDHTARWRLQIQHPCQVRVLTPRTLYINRYRQSKSALSH